MASSLPNNPSLDRLKGDARRLQRGITTGDRDAVDLVRRCHPKPSIALASIGLADVPSRFALHDAQLTVARSYGFTGWPALVHYLRIAANFTVDPHAVDEDARTRLIGSVRSAHCATTMTTPRRAGRPPRTCSPPIRCSSTGTCGLRPRRRIPRHCAGI